MTAGTFNDWLQTLPLIAILRGVKPEEILDIGQVLVDAGFRIIEVPLNSPAPLSSIEKLSARFGDQILTGAGTVLDPASVPDVKAAGGQLIVMPHADAQVVHAARSRGMYALPGFATPTEAFRMLEAGADAIKLFPAEAASPQVLKAMRAVLPSGTAVVPVGGITPDKLAAYWQAGASGFGLGSALYKAGMSASQVAENAERFRRATSALRAATDAS
ncbi:MAG: 2-dehydro-3-deoxy-6-phosphogalactonate aldolase [Betaproteobacteria bacterium]|nr:MAG: 2-dehydro-3-deoxy-6-phosphogalactonate aldolase [Betaproteobacteria bacterium]